MQGNGQNNSRLTARARNKKTQGTKGRAEPVSTFNYPYEALEEVVSNAVYHKSWDDRNPIELNIYPDRITVYNIEGPVPPITNADLQKEHVICRNYRNRRVGDFLKELDLTEGRNTGFPKIYREMRKNGNPNPLFETDDRNMHFMVTIPINPLFEPQNEPKNLSERQMQIVTFISNHPNLSKKAMAKELGISFSTLRRELSAMSDIVKYFGASKGGHWEIIR